MDYNKIKELSYQDRLNLLKDNNFIKKIFLIDSKKDIFSFSKILELYEVKDLLPLFSKEIMLKTENMYKGQEFVYLENFILKDKDTFYKYLINNYDLTNYFLIHGEPIYFNLKLPYNIVIYLVNYIDNNNIDLRKTCFNNILYFSLKDRSLQKKYLNENIKSVYKTHILGLFDKDLVNDYIKNNIIYINNKDLFHLIKYNQLDINPNLYNNKDFFKDNIIDKSIYRTRLNIDNLSNNIDTSYFDKLFSFYQDKILNMISNNIINYPTNSEIINKILDSNFNIKYNKKKEDITKKIVLEIIFDKLFQDSFRNTLLNINELVSFNNYKLVLSKDKLFFYKEILELYNKDSNNIIDFYNKYKNKYSVSNFYDDLRVTKNESYQLIKDSCLKIKDIKALRNNTLSNKYNVDIYVLDKEPFKMLISCRRSIPDLYNVAPRNCYSLISDNNLNVFYEDGIIYGFNDFDINKIMHVYEGDSYSENLSINTTNLINRVRNINDIISSGMMNEIQILNSKIDENKYERLYPNYIVCFNEINSLSLDASKKLKIPIIIINKEKYHNKNKQILDNYGEQYTNSYNTETVYKDKIL